MKINLKRDFGQQTVTREDGKKVKEIIIEAWNKGEKVTIDFNNILIASVSFFDEAFGLLAFEYSKEDLKKSLDFKNIEEYDRGLLNDILLSRYRQKELGQNGLSRPRKKGRARAASPKKL